MPRKQTKSDTKPKKSTPAVEEEALAELERELEPEELESLEEEFEDEDDDLELEASEEESAAEFTEDAETEVLESEEEGVESLQASEKPDADMEEADEIEIYDEYEEEEVISEPPRRETRQEALGRLMLRLLDDREKVHQALERVRDLKTQLDDASPRPPEKLKEQYHKAVTDLSQARREENFARSDLMQVLSWRG